MLFLAAVHVAIPVAEKCTFPMAKPLLNDDLWGQIQRLLLSPNGSAFAFPDATQSRFRAFLCGCQSRLDIHHCTLLVPIPGHLDAEKIYL